MITLKFLVEHLIHTPGAMTQTFRESDILYDAILCIWCLLCIETVSQEDIFRLESLILSVFSFENNRSNRELSILS